MGRIGGGFEVPLTGTTALCNWPDHPHIGRVHLEVPRNTDCPSKLASCEPLTERRAQPITGIRQHAAKAHTAAMARSISARAISGFVRAVRHSAGTPARSNRDRLLVLALRLFLPESWTDAIDRMRRSPAQHCCRQ